MVSPPPHCSVSGPYVLRKHWHPLVFGEQSSGKHAHASPGAGHPFGAQQIVRAITSSLHTNEFGESDSVHEHGRPLPKGSGTQRVVGLGGAGAHAPGQARLTHAASALPCVESCVAPMSFVQLSPRVRVHASRSASVPSRPARHT